jgi:hypothetical protein
MQRVVVCAGHQCLDASMTTLGGERPMTIIIGLYIPGHYAPLPLQT